MLTASKAEIEAKEEVTTSAAWKWSVAVSVVIECLHIQMSLLVQMITLVEDGYNGKGYEACSSWSSVAARE